MLRQGMPMEKIEPPQKFYQANQRAINAEEALLAALNSCASVSREITQIDWPSKEAFGTWIRRLQGQRINAGNVVALESLSYLSLENNIFYFTDLYGAILSGARLVGANFKRAYLGNANLQDIKWNKETVWDDVKGIESARNIPAQLKRQLGLT